MTIDKDYGLEGIDTSYEREIINYRPNIYLPEKDRFYRIDPTIVQKIERAEDFSVSSSLTGYDSLIELATYLMSEIENRNDTDLFRKYKNLVLSQSWSDVDSIEVQQSSVEGNGDYEIYTMLYRMKSTFEMQRSFVDSSYRTQITDESDVSKVMEKEKELIEQWIADEQSFLDTENQLKEAYQHDHAYSDDEDEDTFDENVAYLEDSIYQQQLAKTNKEELYTSIADNSYVHRNRIVMYQEILDQLRFLVIDPSSVMKSDVRNMILMLQTATDLGAVAAHILHAFEEVKTEHAALKGQYAMVDDHKESYVSNQQWFYQQLTVKSGSTVKNWLYEQSESGEAFNSLANILVGSLGKSQDMYDSSIVDMARFYQQEAIFYMTQVGLLRKKEEIRLFLRIIEDLQDTNPITDAWLDEYLRTHGYRS